jgi:pimeloyl-ACP methyl ester carboxylesterase
VIPYFPLQHPYSKRSSIPSRSATVTSRTAPSLNRCGERKIVKAFSFLFCLVALLTLRAFGDTARASSVRENLHRGGFETYHFAPNSTARAIILFGSGDGGWGNIEQKICGILQKNGCYLVGIDCRRYARSDYDSVILVDDFREMAADALRRAGNPNLPVIYAGWSMGAVQAVAGTGGDRRPPGLLGLLLISMDSRGRYGLRWTDEMGLSPIGQGTFAVADFTSTVSDLRVVQYEAIGDWMNNSDWIKTLKSPHRLYQVPNANHDFNSVNDDFQNVLLQGLNWILERCEPPANGQPRRY